MTAVLLCTSLHWHCPISFLNELCPDVLPSQRFAFEHDDVDFQCNNYKADFPPLWNISGELHSYHNLPSNYIYRDRILTLFNVQIEDNRKTFQCVFENATYSSYGDIVTLAVYTGELSCL